MRRKNCKYIIITTFIICFFLSITGTGVAADRRAIANSVLITDTIKKKNAPLKIKTPSLNIGKDTTKNSIEIVEESAIIEEFSPNDTTSIVSDTIKSDSTKKTSKFVDEIIATKNKDSLIMDMRKELLHLYKGAEVKYVGKQLDANYITIDLKTNNIFARGHADSTGVFEKTTFKEGEIDYKMDSITFNMKSEKGKIYGAFFKEGEGFVHGENIKKVGNVMNIKGAKYTTCEAEHPHFYLQSTKAQFIDDNGSKKIVIGTSYIVLEDVPLPLILPFGFFPLMTDRSSGIIMPTFGEENLKGFYLRDGGWYQVINDHLDVALTGGIYTLGSWNLDLSSNYTLRYKFRGNFKAAFSNDKFGLNGDTDFQDMKNYSVVWSHSQDPKARPGSSFSASVNFTSSGYSKLDGNVQNSVQAQTNSKISYSKTWIGTPFSISSALQMSQSNKDSSVLISLPGLVFNVRTIYPFKRKIRIGEERWYEKIGVSYTLNFDNSVKTKENEMFSSKIFDNMAFGFKHTIPLRTSFNLFKFINISPSINYDEIWYFDKIDKSWNPNTNKVEETKIKDFNRLYTFNMSVNATATVYGMYQFGKNSKVEALRHVMTPSIGFSYAPNFSADQYGYYKPVQTDSTGTISYYSPFEKGIYGVPGRGANASMTFNLSNNLEMKVKSSKDSTGVKKVKILESFDISTSYNFLADSLNLAPISFNARTTLFNSLGIQLRGEWDLYYYNENGLRTRHFAWGKGSAGRVTNLSITLGYSLRSVLGFSGSGTGTGAGSLPATPAMEPLQGTGLMGAPSYNERLKQQAMLNVKYYDFSIPWNVTMNYTLNLQNTGIKKQLNQTLNLTGAVNLTPKWAVSINAAIDLQAMKLATSSISVVRDLHCWQMSVSWVPTGFRSSWSFNINVKSSVLQDLRFQRSSSFLDNYYNTY